MLYNMRSLSKKFHHAGPNDEAMPPQAQFETPLQRPTLADCIWHPLELDPRPIVLKREFSPTFKAEQLPFTPLVRLYRRVPHLSNFLLPNPFLLVHLLVSFSQYAVRLVARQGFRLDFMQSQTPGVCIW